MGATTGVVHREVGPAAAQADDQTLATRRYRLARWASAANLVSRGCGMLVTLATVQFTLPYLGAERFGAWMLLASLTAMLSFLDLGIGNAMTNRCAQAATREHPEQLQAVVSGGLLALAAMACASALALGLAAWTVPWHWLLRSQDAALIAEVRTAGLVFAGCFAAFLFSGGVQKVFLGLQRSFEAHLAMAVASLLSLALLYLAAQARAGIAVLLAATAVTQVLVSVVLCAVLSRRGQLRAGAAVSGLRAESRHLLRTGGLFLALQIGAMVGWGADSLIVGASLGSAEVAVYAVAQRLFLFVTLPAALLNQPLWGAYADAHARGEPGFIARTLRRSLWTTTALTGVLAAALLLFHGPIIDTWTRHSLQVPLGFLAVFALWSVIEALATAASMYLNGCNVVQPQVFAVLAFCVLSIPAKLVLAQHAGLVGLVAGTIVCYLVAVPLLYALFFRDAVCAPLRPSPP